MMQFDWKEFKPAMLFLAKFVGIYLVANLLYGLYVSSYRPKPDPITRNVSDQTAAILRATGYTVISQDSENKPTTRIEWQDRNVLSIYEGCNGINTAIIFLAFIVAFGPLRWNAVFFTLAGLLIIHVTNLLRILWLFLVAVKYPQYLYFSHKYLFTAALYFVIFVLWMLWVKKFSRKPSADAV